MLRKMMTAFMCAVQAALTKLTAGSSKGKPVAAVNDVQPLTPEELLRQNEQAVADATQLSSEFQGLTLDEQLALRNGVFTALMIQKAADDVLRINNVWNGLVLADLRQPVGRLRRAALRLRQGRTRSAAKHLGYARALLARTESFCHRTTANDRGLQVAVAERRRALAFRN
jgi:hypothetical protein